MDVSFSASVSGVKTTQERQDYTANNVANVESKGYSMIEGVQAEQKNGGVRMAALNRIPNPDPNTSNTDLAQTTVNQIENKVANAANLAVIKVQDRMLGTLLDLNA
jgi:flagellar hook protein FlgE